MGTEFWSKKWGREHICPITQGRLRPGKDRNGKPYVVELECSHRFYRSALIEWYITSKSLACPVCRQCGDKLITCVSI